MSNQVLVHVCILPCGYNYTSVAGRKHMIPSDTSIVREDAKRMEVMCVCGSGVHLTYEDSEEKGGFHDTFKG